MKIEDIEVGKPYQHSFIGCMTVTAVGRRAVLAHRVGEADEIICSPALFSRIAPPAPKVRLLAIKWSSATMDGPNVYEFVPGSYSRLGNAPEEAGFFGYLFEDGTIRATPTAPWPGSKSICTSLSELEADPAIAAKARATHVVCMEVAP